MAAKGDDAGHDPIDERGGRARGRGAPFDPSAVSFEAAAAPTVRLPRPTRHRFPISPELYARLKERAGSREAPRLELRATTVAADSARQTPEVAAADGMVAFAPAAAPAAAPTAVASFEGIPFNGSFPFDATM